MFKIIKPTIPRNQGRAAGHREEPLKGQLRHQQEATNDAGGKLGLPAKEPSEASARDVELVGEVILAET